MKYVRQRFLSDELQFRGFKQHESLHIPKCVGPFQVKSLSIVQYMEGFLEQLNLEKAKPVAYDPHKVISNMRLENKNSPYDCTMRLDLENIANKDKWEEVEKILKDSTEPSDSEKVAMQNRGEEDM